ncbi:EAL domain-containing protein [Anoxybacteroides amylolyticum]|uniref:Diguanylate cyclase domain protein n=1 Tax=Anoxybacteroides amylolyticum TaxID=294699 RepID=A0A160F5J6_9BACL|nr:EAL domain-containing protein [Anoxybacillus amylolyticus]ANB61023.1 diguanylate cyclase domain protein [Anoxybacillus amylolyticus]
MEQNQFVQKLLADEQLLFTVMEQLFDIIFFMKVEAESRFRYVHVSPKALDLAGLTEEDIGKCIDDIYPKMIADHLNSQYRKVVETKSIVTYRDQMNIAGEYRVGESTLLPIFDRQGEVLYVLSFTRDITETVKREEQFTEIHQLFHLLFAHSHDALVMFDLTGRILQVNKEIERLLGWEKEKICSQNIFRIFPEYRSKFEQSLMQLSKGESLTSVWMSLPHQTGAKVYVSANVMPVFDQNGRVVAGLAMLRDFTDLVTVKERLRQSEELYRKVVEFLPDMIVIQVDGDITYINSAGLRMIKAKQLYEVEGKPLHFFLQQIDHQEWVLTALDGSRKEVNVREMTIPYYTHEAKFLVIRDVSEQKSIEKEMEYMAQYDVLTGLYNRQYLREKLNELLLNYTGLAVLLIDIHRFKFINDFLGHANGDELLRQVARRLKGIESERTMLARVSDDEFVVACIYEQEQELKTLLEKLDRLLQEPYFIAGEKLNITTNIGISYACDANLSVETLLSNADKAVYYSKMNGTNRIVEYEAHMQDIFVKKIRLENDLQIAIEKEELSLHYQPKVNISLGTISLEALVRWNHPQFGMISPAEFIPIAEETNMIHDIGRWVLRQACRDLKKLQQAGFYDIKMAVNLSARQFLDKQLESVVSNIFTKEQTSPSFFVFEITETAIMKEPAEVVPVLQKLKQRGITIAIDDFGVSYSSLNYLNRFPIDAVKIDRSFIRNISDNQKGEEIVRAIISLAHQLHLFVTAEGVETEEQVRFLLEKGCEEMQGYYFSRPVPLEQLPSVLENVQSLIGRWRNK